jgi:hypothetical protein
MDDKEFNLNLKSSGNWNLRKIMPRVIFVGLPGLIGWHSFFNSAKIEELTVKLAVVEQREADCRKDLDLVIRRQAEHLGSPAKPETVPGLLRGKQTTKPKRQARKTKPSSLVTAADALAAPR